MNSKLKDIMVWYKFRPNINIWFSKMKGCSKQYILPDETWYNGYPFISGWFCFLQYEFFAIHIRLIWWKIKL